MNQEPTIDEAGPLGRLAAAHGVNLTWTDDTGSMRAVSEESIMAVVSALIDESVTTDSDVAEALAMAERTRRIEVVSPVIVAERGRLAPIELPEGAEGAVLLGEDGSTLAGHAEGTSVTIDEILPIGLYTLTVGTSSGHHIATVISTPDPAFMPAPPSFGVGTDVLELRGRRGIDQGRGHVGLMQRLAETLDRHSVKCISTSSLLPHRPIVGTSNLGVMTRRGWTEWIVDVSAAPGAAGLGVDWSAAANGPKEAATNHRAALTTYSGLVGDHPALRAELDRYLVAHPHVARYARFVALGETLSEDWRRWPAPWRSGDLTNCPVDEARELYHQVAQWLADTQLRAAVRQMAGRGQSLEMFLDIGVHPHGYDYWQQPHLFSTRATTGRPPSVDSPGANNLLPAARPAVAHSDGFRSFASAVRHQLAGGILHVPAIEAFHRSWWIPAGAEPGDGAFVNLGGNELLAVVRLEAHRLGATVVASDSPFCETGVRPLVHEPPRIVSLSDLDAERSDDGRMARPVDHALADADMLAALSKRRDDPRL